jgi:hypothetical protein
MHYSESRARARPRLLLRPRPRGRRGRIDDDEYWLYDALGPRIWIHVDNERHPDRPLVFVLEVERQARAAPAHRRPGDLREVRIHGPSRPSLPPFDGPPIGHAPGPHRMELTVGDGGAALTVSDALVLRS